MCAGGFHTCCKKVEFLPCSLWRSCLLNQNPPKYLKGRGKFPSKILTPVPTLHSKSNALNITDLEPKILSLKYKQPSCQKFTIPQSNWSDGVGSQLHLSYPHLSSIIVYNFFQDFQVNVNLLMTPIFWRSYSFDTFVLSVQVFELPLWRNKVKQI